jgi:peroxin-7
MDMDNLLWLSNTRNWKMEDALVAKCEHHTEFVLGLDFNLFVDGLISTCSWDR